MRPGAEKEGDIKPRRIHTLALRDEKGMREWTIVDNDVASSNP
jgi:hypothetical protein